MKKVHRNALFFICFSSLRSYSVKISFDPTTTKINVVNVNILTWHVPRVQ